MNRPEKIFLIIISVIVLIVIWAFKFAKNYPTTTDLEYRSGYFGVTYSKKLATELGLDWKQAYLAMLDELQVKQVRLPIYWDEIEVEPGVFNFSDYDYLLSEGAKRQVKFIVSIGYRLPRWPECHRPEWSKLLPPDEFRNRTLRMLKLVVERYQVQPAIEYWQVENEPLLDVFGDCPTSDVNFLQQEVNLVKSLDSRLILISASGELGSWIREAKIGDIFGNTLYRVVWGPWTGYFRYPLPSWFYRFKAHLARIPAERRMIIELQAEPWAPQGSLADLPAKEAGKSFNLEQFKANVQYGINVNFERAYLWGVEWWYLQAQLGHPQYWDLAKTLFK